MSCLAYLPEVVERYLRFYHGYVLRKWHYMGPMEYGIILLVVGAFGFVLMKNASRR